MFICPLTVGVECFFRAVIRFGDNLQGNVVMVINIVRCSGLDYAAVGGHQLLLNPSAEWIVLVGYSSLFSSLAPF